ncbi:MAG TPA: hypothetical protein PKN52_09255, partial [Trueperaceae bacterium]|nr:hypothetical protein [Trueperaceae bacterium]
AQLFKKVANGVVLVLTEDGIGSGSLITPEGDIITNWHVVGDYKVVGVVFRRRRTRPARRQDDRAGIAPGRLSPLSREPSTEATPPLAWVTVCRFRRA